MNVIIWLDIPSPTIEKPDSIQIPSLPSPSSLVDWRSSHATSNSDRTSAIKEATYNTQAIKYLLFASKPKSFQKHQLPILINPNVRR